MEDYISPYLRLPRRSLDEVRSTTHRHMPDQSAFLLGPDEVFVPVPRKDRRIMLACFAAAFLSLGYAAGPYIVLALQAVFGL